MLSGHTRPETQCLITVSFTSSISYIASYFLIGFVNIGDLCFMKVFFVTDQAEIDRSNTGPFSSPSSPPYHIVEEVSRRYLIGWCSEHLPTPMGFSHTSSASQRLQR